MLQISLKLGSFLQKLGSLCLFSCPATSFASCRESWECPSCFLKWLHCKRVSSVVRRPRRHSNHLTCSLHACSYRKSRCFASDWERRWWRPCSRLCGVVFLTGGRNPPFSSSLSCWRHWSASQSKSRRLNRTLHCRFRRWLRGLLVCRAKMCDF